jgi:hypothetical protein
MVHGIGQRLEKANLVDDVVDFRRVTANLAERYLTSYQRSTQRVLFIPCQVKTSVNPAKFFPLSNTQESCTFFFFSYKSTLVQKTPLDLLVCLSHTQQNPSNMSVLIKNSGLRHLKIRVNMQSIVKACLVWRLSRHTFKPQVWRPIWPPH